MKLDVELLRYLTRDDFRVLTALEQGMKNHDVVPTELISAISGLRSGVVKVLGNLLHHKLIFHDASLYDGYRLTYPGYDFLALRTLLQRGVLAAVGRQIGVGKESDVYLGASAEGAVFALKLQRLGRVSFRAVKRTRDYLQGRKSVGWLYMSRLATLKEFAFMQALHDAGFPVPTPVACNRHLLIMSLAPGRTLYLRRSLPRCAPPLAPLLWERAIGVMMRLAAAGLVHCDFNEFNLLLHVGGDAAGAEDGEGGGGAAAAVAVAGGAQMFPIVAAIAEATAAAVTAAADGGGAVGAPPPPPPPPDFTLTLIDFPQMVSISHPNAVELFERDVRSLVLFFQRRFGFTPAKWPNFEAARAAAAEAVATAAAAEGAGEVAVGGGGGGGGGRGGAGEGALDKATEASGHRGAQRDASAARPRPAAILSAVRAAGFSEAHGDLLDGYLAESVDALDAVGGAGGEEEGARGGGEDGGEAAGAASLSAPADGAEAFVVPSGDVLEGGGDEGGGESGSGDEEEGAGGGRGGGSGGDGYGSGDGEDDDNSGDDDVSGGSEQERDLAHERALLAERPPVPRSKANGQRVKERGRGGEAYLNRKREAAEAAAAAAAAAAGGAGAAPSAVDIALKVRKARERAERDRALATASAKAGRGRGSQKDPGKQRAREAAKGAADPFWS